MLSICQRREQVHALQLQGPVSDSPVYMQQWSKVEPLTYPGGTYKYSNVQNFPGAAGITAALITLFPGGLRELHWHNTTEWAIVLNGSCR